MRITYLHLKPLFSFCQALGLTVALVLMSWSVNAQDNELNKSLPETRIPFPQAIAEALQQQDQLQFVNQNLTWATLYPTFHVLNPQGEWVPSYLDEITGRAHVATQGKRPLDIASKLAEFAVQVKASRQRQRQKNAFHQTTNISRPGRPPLGLPEVVLSQLKGPSADLVGRHFDEVVFYEASTVRCGQEQARACSQPLADGRRIALFALAGNPDPRWVANVLIAWASKHDQERRQQEAEDHHLKAQSLQKTSNGSEFDPTPVFVILALVLAAALIYPHLDPEGFEKLQKFLRDDPKAGVSDTSSSNSNHLNSEEQPMNLEKLELDQEQGMQILKSGFMEIASDNPHLNMPPVPGHSFQYEGWVVELFKRVRLRSHSASLEQQNRLYQQLSRLYDQVLPLAQKYWAIKQLPFKAICDLIKLEREASKQWQELMLDRSRFEAQVSQIEHQVILETKKTRLELAKLQAEIDEILTPKVKETPEQKAAQEAQRRQQRIDAISRVQAECEQQVGKTEDESMKEAIRKMYRKVIDRMKAEL